LKKIEEYKIKVKRLEEGLNKSLKVVFETKFGEYSLEVKKEKYSFFYPGKEYKGIFKVSGMPDFICREDKWENVCTRSYELKKILDGKWIIYRR
jgi:hypothetical protein